MGPNKMFVPLVKDKKVSRRKHLVCYADACIAIVCQLAETIHDVAVATALKDSYRVGI